MSFKKKDEIVKKENITSDENETIIQKLFEVVEKFTEKVTKLENMTMERNQ